MSVEVTENPLLSRGDTNEVLIEKGEGVRQIRSRSISSKPRSTSNQRILIFTCATFFLFVIAEIIGAVYSRSLSLLGDAGAMSVDVFTVSLIVSKLS